MARNEISYIDETLSMGGVISLVHTHSAEVLHEANAVLVPVRAPWIALGIVGMCAPAGHGRRCRRDERGGLGAVFRGPDGSPEHPWSRSRRAARRYDQQVRRLACGREAGADDLLREAPLGAHPRAELTRQRR